MLEPVKVKSEQKLSIYMCVAKDQKLYNIIEVHFINHHGLYLDKTHLDILKLANIYNKM